MTTISNPDLERLLAEEAWARKLATALVGAADGDDLVQRAFLKAAEGRYRPEGNPRAWLGQVLRNMAATLHRDRGRRVAREAAVAPAELSEETPEWIEARLDQRRLLLELLGGLPAEQRAALILRYEHGLKSAQIAERLNCAESTVRVRIQRGLSTLREQLDRRPGGREVWVSAMLPLTLPPRAAVASAAGLTLGPWIAAAVGVATLLLGWRLWSAAVDPAPELGPTAATLVADSLSSDAVAPLDAPLPGATVRTSSSAPAPADAVPAAPAALSTRLRAVFVDTSGQVVPFVDVELEVGGRRFEANADESGVAQLETTELRTKLLATLTARGPNRAQFRDRFQVLPGRTNDLGALTLLPGSEVQGRVLDANGDPAIGGRVAVLADAVQPDAGQLLLEVLPDALAKDRSRSDGRFSAMGALVGDLRLWYRDDASRWTAGPRLDLRLGELSGPHDLRLGTEHALPRTTLELLTSAGEPATGASIWIATEAGGTTLVEEEAHRFHLEPSDGALLEVVASHPSSGEALRWTGLHPVGAPDLRLRLEPMTDLRVELVGLRAGEGPAGALSIWDPALDVSLSNATVDGVSRTRPHVDLRLPAWPALLTVQLTGYRTERIGPLDPATGALRVELHPIPTVDVLLTEGGLPLEGFTLVVPIRPAPATETRLRNGYPTLYDEFVTTKVRTDGAGRATLAVEDETTRHLLVEPAGRGPRVVAFDPRATGEVQRIELGRPGRIEGRVEFADGAPTAGVLVGLGNEGFDARTARVDEFGRFTFDDVQPGTWYLHRALRLIAPGSFSRGTLHEPLADDWRPAHHVEVPEGGTGSIVLRLPAEQTVPIAGSLTLDGRPAANWKLRVRPRRPNIALDDARPTLIEFTDELGAFELRAESSPYQLTLNDPEQPLAPTFELEVDDLGSGLDWRLELATGALTLPPGTALPALLEGELQGGRWSLELPDGSALDGPLLGLPRGPALLRPNGAESTVAVEIE